MTNPLYKILGSFRRWMRALAGEPAPEAPQPPVYWDERVSLTLCNLVQETETRASGRVQVISLADFRTSVGDLWDKYQTKILIIVDSTIGRMIGKGNTYIPQDDNAWLLLFPGLTEDKAQERADAIAASIGEKLMGAQFTEHEVPMPEASRLDLGGALNADGSLNMDAIKRAISTARRKQISTIVARKKIEAQTSSPRPGTGGATMVQSSAAQLKPFFKPAWCAETESIDLFFFRAADSKGLDIYADGMPTSNDATILDLTRTAIAAFKAMCEAGLNAKMSIPLPFTAMQGSMLKEVQKLVVSLGQRERLLRLRVEIVQIPSDATADMLVAIRELFRPYVREVAFFVDLFIPHEQALALDHVMLGCDVSGDADLSEEKIFQDMLMFRQRAGRRGTYILGLQSKPHLKRAINAGIAEVAGPALTDEVTRLPHRVAIIQREELLLP